MIIYRGSSIFFASAALLVCSGASAALSFRLDPPSILLGEHTVLTVRLPEKDLVRPEGSDPDEAPVQQDDLLVQSPHLQILAQEYRKEDDHYVWRYELTSYEAGKLHLPPIEIRMGPQTFSTESVELTVLNPRPEGDQTVRPDFGPVSEGLPWERLFFATLTLLLAAGAAYFWKKFYKKRIKPPAEAPKPPPEIPEDWLRRRLFELKRLLEAGGQAVAVVDRLAGVLREYFSRKTTKPVTSWTTREMAAELKRVAGPDTGLVPWFERTDDWKFTGEAAKPTAQSDADGLARSGIEVSERGLLGKAPRLRENRPTEK